MGQVWALALPRSERDVLLALADHAHDDGTSARPGVPYLVWKLDLAKSTVVAALRGLEEKGIIAATRSGGGRGRVTEYSLDLEKGTKKRPFTERLNRPIDSAKPSDPREETVRSSLAREEEPSGTISRATTTALAVRESAASPRPPNPIWDLLVEFEGEPLPRFKTARGRIVSDLRELLVRDGIRDVDAALTEIRRRRDALIGEWGEAKATLRSLVNNWTLAGKLADGTSRGPTRRTPGGAPTPEEMLQRARELSERGE